MRAILFDRDGTLVEDVPYNGDPDRVQLMPDATAAVATARKMGWRVAVVSNQSGVARGVLSLEQVSAVNGRVARLIGPVDAWLICPHHPDSRCGCRKPAPGLVHAAARALGCATEETVVVGDIAADVEAAQRAGTVGILVPNDATLREEVAEAEYVASTLLDAVELASTLHSGAASKAATT